ncbi:MAG: EAL domain-containing protein [Clostridia bacterium]|nr:EAL domain-containing protein [Clostridia bacterium]
MIIGVCLSELHLDLNTGFVAELDRAVREVGGEIVVFTTSMDLNWYKKENQAARSIFRAIHYEIFSALVIVSNSFHDEKLFDQIVQEADTFGVPVISVGAIHQGCHNIVNNPVPAFKALLRHVIQEHGARDTFFLSGIKGEPNAELRLQCYREVLEELGLPFDERNVDWGNYWSQPASAITLRLIQERPSLPDAIFCANDTMAMSVCDTLKNHGFRVPEDVIVTGFDGVPAASMIRPRLSTVTDNQSQLAQTVVNMIRQLSVGMPIEDPLYNLFRPVYSESCGCPVPEESQYDALSLFNTLESERTHENRLYHTVERMLMQTELQDFLQILSHALPSGSAVYLNQRYLDVFHGKSYDSTEIEEELLRLPAAPRSDQPKPEMITLHHSQPLSSLRTGVIVTSAIHSDTVVFGYFSAQTLDLRTDIRLIKRIADVLNLVFTIQLGNLQKQNLLAHIERSAFQDPLTGMSNLKGLTQWYEDFCARQDNHRLFISLSIYEISRYSYIYETYGIQETETIVRRIGEALSRINPTAPQTARISDNQFVVFDCEPGEALLSNKIKTTVADFYRTMTSYNAENNRDYYLEIHAGCTTMASGWKTVSLENLIRLATGELYLNRLKAAQHDVVKDTHITAELYTTFSLLMEKNLFRYHFQPIVHAKTGQIVAYEALMRTDSLVNLNPLQVLAIAREYGRLYDVEKATFFGIMEQYVQHYSAFQGSKVFINTIPGFFLNAADCQELKNRFQSYLDCFVIELTEQDSTSDEELIRLKQLSKPGSQAQIAIDDYGTGHSNMVNVLRYGPQFIKIDRALISGIEEDSNKQLFVRNTIEFAHQNGIRALAEGVETEAELRTVIGYGVDLIQGYYTARPAEQPIQAISESIRAQILEENLRLARYDSATKTYTVRNGETVDLFELAIHQFSSLEIPEGIVTLTSQEGSQIGMTLRVRDDAETTLILNSVSLRAGKEPVLQLGSNSRVHLILQGNNLIQRDGIRVPGNASLLISGQGSLLVDSTRNFSVGIGGSFNDTYGTIILDLEGRLEVHGSGDKAVCIGGSRSAGEGIILKRGDIKLAANGINALGIGSTAGSAVIRLQGGRLQCHLQGNDAVGIGTLSGFASVAVNAETDILLESERAVGLGTMNGTMEVRLPSGQAGITIRCDVGSCIGNFNGEGTSYLTGAKVSFHGEGNRVTGLGSIEGACDTRIEAGYVQGDLLASSRRLLGNNHSRVIITGGNIRLFPDDGSFPVSPGGQPLALLNPEGDTFEKTFKDKRATWSYKAARSEDGYLGVWVPRA